MIYKERLIKDVENLGQRVAWTVQLYDETHNMWAFKYLKREIYNGKESFYPMWFKSKADAEKYLDIHYPSELGPEAELGVNTDYMRVRG